MPLSPSGVRGGNDPGQEQDTDQPALYGGSAPHPARGIGRNAATLAFANLTCKAGSLLVVPVILRSFSKTDYGAYSAAFAYAGLLGMVTYFGMGPAVVRDIARGDRAKGWVVFHCVALRMALYVLAAAGLVVLGLARHFTPQMWLLSCIAFASMGFDAVTGVLRSSMQAEERFGLMAWVDIARKACQWLLALAVVFAGVGIAGLAGAVVAAAVAAMAAAVFLGLRRADLAGLRLDLSYAWAMLKLSAPMGLSAAFVLVIERVDLYVLDVLRGPSDVAEYAAGVAFKPAFLAQAVVWAMLPMAFRLGKHDKPALAAVVARGARYLIIAGTACAIVFWSGGRALMPLLGGAQYSASIPVFRIVGLCLPFVFAGFLYLHALTAVDRQPVAAMIFAAGLAANLAVDLALVPSLGPAGAILGTLVCETLVAVGALLAVWRFVGRPFSGADARLLLSIASAVAASAFTGMVGFADMGIVALSVFAVTLVWTGAFTGKDLALLRQSFNRRADNDIEGRP